MPASLVHPPAMITHTANEQQTPPGKISRRRQTVRVERPSIAEYLDQLEQNRSVPQAQNTNRQTRSFISLRRRPSMNTEPSTSTFLVDKPSTSAASFGPTRVSPTVEHPSTFNGMLNK